VKSIFTFCRGIQAEIDFCDAGMGLRACAELRLRVTCRGFLRDAMARLRELLLEFRDFPSPCPPAGSGANPPATFPIPRRLDCPGLSWRRDRRDAKNGLRRLSRSTAFRSVLSERQTCSLNKSKPRLSRYAPLKGFLSACWPALRFRSSRIPQVAQHVAVIIQHGSVFGLLQALFLNCSSACRKTSCRS